jgi:hypothetical protein
MCGDTAQISSCLKPLGEVRFHGEAIGLLEVLVAAQEAEQTSDFLEKILKILESGRHYYLLMTDEGLGSAQWVENCANFCKLFQNILKYS